MAQNRRLLVTLGAAVVGALALVGVVAAIQSGDDDKPVSNGNGDGNGAAGPTVPALPGAGHGQTLDEARRDLADRLGVDIEDVVLRSVEVQGWDGCMGVYKPDVACTEQYQIGLAAFFTVNDDVYRYHVIPGQFIATDFEDGEVRDMPATDDLGFDVNAALVRYAQLDLAHRLDVDLKDIVVSLNVPVTFPDLCLGVDYGADTACADAIAPGAIVILLHDGDDYRYHVAPSGGVVALTLDDLEPSIDVDPAMQALMDAMREDLAERLGVEADGVSFGSVKEVTWSDGCIGVHYKDAMCSQALVDGYLVYLTAQGVDGAFRYHVGNGDFIAVDFLDDPDAMIREPLPRQAD